MHPTGMEPGQGAFFIFFLMAGIIFKAFAKPRSKRRRLPRRIQVGQIAKLLHTESGNSLLPLLGHYCGNGGGQRHKIVPKGHRRYREQVAEHHRLYAKVTKQNNGIMIAVYHIKHRPLCR